VAIVAAVIAIAVIGAVFWMFQYGPEAEDHISLQTADYDDLPGWSSDDLTEFLPALHKSCTKMLTLPDTRAMGGSGMAGTVKDWRGLCEQSLALPPQADVIRSFFETNFTPVQVSNNYEESGLFTGYYEASLKGSLTREGPYLVPLYLRPPELVMVDLGRFREELKGQRIAGKVIAGNLEPYADRAEITNGALNDRELELVWVDSEIDAFFLQIQGSGVVEMNDGSILRVGYAAQNGHPYFAIGRALIDQGEIPQEKMSMQAIRIWLEENPDRVREIMHMNASYVFFRKLEGNGPVGAQGVELTPERSLAVDRKWMPLGVPVFLKTEVSAVGQEENLMPFRKLLMAQDTGGAIRGPVRGDVFWGYGDRAYEMSGGMKSDGRYWILLPNKLAEKINMDPAT
jgi:membrane-bound lytic murein transglycosylase A